jgi:hypothetical protein
MVVQPSIGVIEVGNLRQVAHPFVGLLQHGNADGHVVGRLQVLAILVLEVFLLNVEEELGVVGSQVAGDEGVGAVGVLAHGREGEGPGEANRAGGGEEVGVDEPQLLLLEDCVEQLEHLPAHQLVVPIHDQENLLGPAVLLSSSAQVGHRLHLPLVSQDPVPIWGN